MSLSKYKAAHCFTKSIVSPETSNHGISLAKFSVISLVTVLAIRCNAKVTRTAFLLLQSSFSRCTKSKRI